jgi:thiol-disulfide isomerase/thioredoxin
MTYSMPRKILPIILLALGFILVLTSIYFVSGNQASRNELSAVPAKVNFPAPELTLTDIQGGSRSLADYRGQVVLVNLWATWCPPCKEEMPTKLFMKNTEKSFIIAINDSGQSGCPAICKISVDFPGLVGSNSHCNRTVV